MKQVLLSPPESQRKPGLATPPRVISPKGTLNIPRSNPILNKYACLSLRCQAAADRFRHRLAQVALWPESSNGSGHACRSSHAPSASTMAAACAYEEDIASLQPHMDAQGAGRALQSGRGPSRPTQCLSHRRRGTMCLHCRLLAAQIQERLKYLWTRAQFLLLSLPPPLKSLGTCLR